MSELEIQAIIQNIKGWSEEDIKLMLKQIKPKFLVQEIYERLEEADRKDEQVRELFGI